MSRIMEYRTLSQEEYNCLQDRILYEDNHLFVINKLAGEIVQGDKTGDECLAELCKAFIAQRDHKPGKVFLGVPHRLDRPVSGAVILAKTSKSLERLCAMFRDGNVHKTYVAMTCNPPAAAEGELQDWLWRNEKMNKSFISTEGKKDAKLARLRYKLAGKTERYWLIEVELLTGRHHQIRCQLAHAGCVIKGDLKYGAPRSNPDGSICLHARHISLTHPVGGAQVDIIAPYPRSWKGVAE